MYLFLLLFCYCRLSDQILLRGHTLAFDGKKSTRKIECQRALELLEEFLIVCTENDDESSDRLLEQASVDVLYKAPESHGAQRLHLVMYRNYLVPALLVDACVARVMCMQSGRDDPETPVVACSECDIEKPAWAVKDRTKCGACNYCHRAYDGRSGMTIHSLLQDVKYLHMLLSSSFPGVQDLQECQIHRCLARFEQEHAVLRKDVDVISRGTSFALEFFSNLVSPVLDCLFCTVVGTRALLSLELFVCLPQQTHRIRRDTSVSSFQAYRPRQTLTRKQDWISWPELVLFIVMLSEKMFDRKQIVARDACHGEGISSALEKLLEMGLIRAEDVYGQRRVSVVPAAYKQTRFTYYWIARCVFSTSFGAGGDTEMGNIPESLEFDGLVDYMRDIFCIK